LIRIKTKSTVPEPRISMIIISITMRCPLISAIRLPVLRQPVNKAGLIMQTRLFARLIKKFLVFSGLMDYVFRIVTSDTEECKSQSSLNQFCGMCKISQLFCPILCVMISLLLHIVFLEFLILFILSIIIFLFCCMRKMGIQHNINHAFYSKEEYLFFGIQPYLFFAKKYHNNSDDFAFYVEWLVCCLKIFEAGDRRQKWSVTFSFSDREGLSCDFLCIIHCQKAFGWYCFS